MVKNLLFLIMGIVLGYWFEPVINTASYQYEEYLNRRHTPKFQVGDCIETFGSFKSRIFEVTADKDYGYTIGTECKDRYSGCSSSIAPARTVDANGVKIACP